MKTTITLSLEIATRMKLERLADQGDTFMSAIVEKLIESAEEAMPAQAVEVGVKDLLCEEASQVS